MSSTEERIVEVFYRGRCFLHYYDAAGRLERIVAVPVQPKPSGPTPEPEPETPPAPLLSEKLKGLLTFRRNTAPAGKARREEKPGFLARLRSSSKPDGEGAEATSEAPRADSAMEPDPARAGSIPADVRATPETQTQPEPHVAAPPPPAIDTPESAPAVPARSEEDLPPPLRAPSPVPRRSFEVLKAERVEPEPSIEPPSSSEPEPSEPATAMTGIAETEVPGVEEAEPKAGLFSRLSRKKAARPAPTDAPGEAAEEAKADTPEESPRKALLDRFRKPRAEAQGTEKADGASTPAASEPGEPSPKEKFALLSRWKRPGKEDAQEAPPEAPAEAEPAARGKRRSLRDRLKRKKEAETETAPVPAPAEPAPEAASHEYTRVEVTEPELTEPEPAPADAIASPLPPPEPVQAPGSMEQSAPQLAPEEEEASPVAPEPEPEPVPYRPPAELMRQVPSQVDRVLERERTRPRYRAEVAMLLARGPPKFKPLPREPWEERVDKAIAGKRHRKD